MKLTNKILMLLVGAATIFTSCSSDDVTREPSPAANPNSNNVYFSETNTANPVLALEATSFEVSLKREKTDAALSVKLEAHTAFDNNFEVPEAASFAAGEAETKIVINVKDLEPFKKYLLEIDVEGDQASLYKDGDGVPRIELNVLKEDFASYATGVYSTEFFEDAYEATLEYSPLLNQYRFSNCWNFGANSASFTWDGGSSIEIIDIDKGTPTGYVHSKYGAVTAYYEGASYDEATKTMTFEINWKVAAGSFGSYPDTFKITSK